MIADPIETVIAALRADSDMAAMVGTRIAVRHKFGDGWAETDNGLTLAPSGGLPHPDLEWQEIDFSVRCWGESSVAAFNVYRRFVDVARGITRRRVALSASLYGLLYYLAPVSGPILLTDPDSGRLHILATYRGAVAEEDILATP